MMTLVAMAVGLMVMLVAVFVFVLATIVMVVLMVVSAAAIIVIVVMLFGKQPQIVRFWTSFWNKPYTGLFNCASNTTCIAKFIYTARGNTPSLRCFFN